MFDNITEKLKRIADILFKISIIIGIIMCIVALVEANDATIALIIAAVIMVGGAYVSCALIYGFAVLIEKTESTNRHVANMSLNAVPRLVNNTSLIADNTKIEKSKVEEN